MKSSGNYIVNTVSGMHIICFNEIKYFEAQGRYTLIFGIQGEILVTKNIGLIEKEVSHGNFARIHHSTLVNMMYVKGYNRIMQEITLKDNTKLKVSYRKKPMLKNKLTLITRMATLIT